VLGDILDTRKLTGLLADAGAAYHLVARVTTPFADADFHGMNQINHWGTAELGYLLEERPVEHVVYLSSASVHGAGRRPAAAGAVPNSTTA
jgi:UDP-glucose 4-epimerase